MSISRAPRSPSTKVSKLKLMYGGGHFPSGQRDFLSHICLCANFLNPWFKKKKSLKMEGEEVKTTTEIIFGLWSLEGGK